MAIREADDGWFGSGAGDIEPYLFALTREEGGYVANAYRPIACGCGSDRFQFTRAGTDTEAQCAACGDVRYVSRHGDREDWEEASEDPEDLESFRCVGCGSSEANLGVAFAGYDDPELDAVRWFWLGLRCVGCGLLGCFNDDKVGYGPAADAHLRVTGNVESSNG
jgi:hypothetical protein